MQQFALDNPERFMLNRRTIDISEVSELLQKIEEKNIEEMYDLLKELDISYTQVKRKKAEKHKLLDREGASLDDDFAPVKPSDKAGDTLVDQSPGMMHKYDEVARFLKDFIMLFVIFNERDNETIDQRKEEIKRQLLDFMKDTNMPDCYGEGDEAHDEMPDEIILNCHFMNILNSKDPESRKIHFTKLKQQLLLFVQEMINTSAFFNIYADCIEAMEQVKSKTQSMKSMKPCSDAFIKDEKVLSVIRDRLTVREEEKNL